MAASVAERLTSSSTPFQDLGQWRRPYRPTLHDRRDDGLDDGGTRRSSSALRSWSAQSSQVVARLAGTSMPQGQRHEVEPKGGRAWPGLVTARVTLTRELMLRGVGGVVEQDVVTSSCSRAIVHSDWIVYIAEPSPWSARTGRSGHATAAPTATGRPWPMAPPVRVSTSWRGAPAVCAGERHARGLGLVGDDRALGQDGPDRLADRVGGERTRRRAAAATAACSAAAPATRRARRPAPRGCRRRHRSGAASSWTSQPSGSR